MRAEKIQLESDEHVLLRVRKHWFLVGTQMFAVVVFALLPALLYGFLLRTGEFANILETISPETLTTLYAGWLLISWMTFWSVWTNYYLDVWTITNKRLIAVDQKGFFYRTTASFRFERLQDIIVSVDGIIPTLLDFGSLEIQTASIEKNFKGYGIPNPSDVKAIILSSTDILIRVPQKGANLE